MTAPPDRPGGGTTAPAYRSAKVRARHLDRLAVVYVRQSTPQQVQDNRESAALQYGLRQRALDLGWPPDRVLVIDQDQGRSGASADGRLGFQRLLAEVGLDHVGLILGLEMSRLARSCKDWHQLLELCGLFHTLLADADGVYDPTDYNDRLLLGLKGTMSEAELHVIRARMNQGTRSKAGRGELFTCVPIGYVRAAGGGVELDPDEQVRSAVRLVFDKFAELGSISALLGYLARHRVRLGVRPHAGPNRGQVEWRAPNRCTLGQMLHHPMYAGAYVYGRRAADPRRRGPGGGRPGRRSARQDEWQVLLPDRVPAYLSWDQYQANRRRLAQNLARHPGLGAPREGPTLLGGLVACGRCGRRLMVYYGNRRGAARYTCSRGKLCYGEPACQSLVAGPLDRLVGGLVLRALEPAALELSLRAAEDVERDRARLHEHWAQRRERASYEADRAARQYRACEPENRLVARELERRWEQALRDQRAVDEEYERFARAQPPRLTGPDRDRIRALAADIPALWDAAGTTPQDRQAIARFLVERVVVTVRGATEWADVAVHWAGGEVSRHEVRRPVVRYDQLRDYDRLLRRVAELRVDGRSTAEVAECLNREGFRLPRGGGTFTADGVRQLVHRAGLGGLPAGARGAEDLPGRDEWWAPDLARRVGVAVHRLNAWRRAGWVHARRLPCGDRGRWVLWADATEVRRLRRLRSHPRGGNDEPYPAALITPKPRSR